MTWYRPWNHIAQVRISKREKLLRQALNSPATMRFADLCALAEEYQFEHDHTNGSHHFYKRADCRTVMNFQKLRDGKAKRYQVKQLLAALRDLGDIE